MNASAPHEPNLLEHLPAAVKTTGAPLWAKGAMIVVAVAMLGGFVYAFQLFSSVSKAFSAASPNSSTPLLKQLQQLIAPPSTPLRGEDHDRINVLLLGMGGAGHDGPLLTDTMIVASIQPSTGAVGLFSIPRDLIVDIPGHDYRKINFANAFGEKKDVPGSGAVFASSIVEQVIGEPIDYFIRVDFGGFAKLIDDVGGVDITVDNTFIDTAYPTTNYGYQTVKFTAGKQHMDGDTALKYVRSRHGNNGEGSDFARSKRQQKVLLAVKDKLFSVQTLLNPPAISKALTTLSAHIQTNFQPWELLRLGNMGKNVDAATVHHRVLDTTQEGLLNSATGLDGAYILEPRLGIGKYAEIQSAFATLLEQPTTATAEEPATIELLNGTPVAGLAARTETKLTSLSVNVAQIGNADTKTAEHTTIYDLHGGQKPLGLTALKNALGATVVVGAPTTQQNVNGDVTQYPGIDFVIVVGLDQVPAKTTNTDTSASTNTAL